MSGKKSQNKFRDMLGDYYKTNRKISEEYEKNEQKGSVTSREKSMIIVMILLLIVLSVKSCLIDEVSHLNAKEQQFKDFVDYSVEQQYHGTLENIGLMKYRVYDIYMADEKEKAVLRYEDPKTGEMIEAVQNGRYNARVRGYFLWIIPIKHFSVTAKIEE